VSDKAEILPSLQSLELSEAIELDASGRAVSGG